MVTMMIWTVFVFIGAVDAEICPPRSKTPGRCGPKFGGGRCDRDYRPWAIYCNSRSGRCGKSKRHKNAQKNEDRFDWRPNSCRVPEEEVNSVALTPADYVADGISVEFGKSCLQCDDGEQSSSEWYLHEKGIEDWAIQLALSSPFALSPGRSSIAFELKGKKVNPQADLFLGFGDGNKYIAFALDFDGTFSNLGSPSVRGMQVYPPCGGQLATGDVSNVLSGSSGLSGAKMKIIRNVLAGGDRNEWTQIAGKRYDNGNTWPATVEIANDIELNEVTFKFSSATVTAECVYRDYFVAGKFVYGILPDAAIGNADDFIIDSIGVITRSEVLSATLTPSSHNVDGIAVGFGASCRRCDDGTDSASEWYLSEKGIEDWAIQLDLSSDFALSAGRSTISFEIDGRKIKYQADIFLGFGDGTKLITFALDFDGGFSNFGSPRSVKGMLVYPQCGGRLAEGDVSTVLTGSRKRDKSKMKAVRNALAGGDRNDWAQIAGKRVNNGNTWPVRIEIVNDIDANEVTFKFSSKTTEEECVYSDAFAAGHFVFGMIPDSARGKNDDFVIDSITVTTALTPSPTPKPTQRPSPKPTQKPTQPPTEKPTAVPTRRPTRKPTAKPTQRPTQKPSRRPTRKPTEKPTRRPTQKPSEAPTSSPTVKPTRSPTAKPTLQPTGSPSTPSPTHPGELICGSHTAGDYNGAAINVEIRMPFEGDITMDLSASDFEVAAITGHDSSGQQLTDWDGSGSVLTVRGLSHGDYSFVIEGASGVATGTFDVAVSCSSAAPTRTPSAAPTRPPTEDPSAAPTEAPSKVPTAAPSKTPTVAPTKRPTESPSRAPTKPPTEGPTAGPTKEPSAAPSPSPSKAPTKSPTAMPSMEPTSSPSEDPTASPTTPSPTDPGELICGSRIAGEYNGVALKVEARMPFDGDMTLDLSASDFEIKNITAFDAEDNLLADADAAAAVLTIQKIGHLQDTRFVIEGADGVTSGTFDIEVRCSSEAPTVSPSADPTTAPTVVPTAAPSKTPSEAPSRSPSPGPTANPSAAPTADPSRAPTDSPSRAPTSVCESYAAECRDEFDSICFEYCSGATSSTASAVSSSTASAVEQNVVGLDVDWVEDLGTESMAVLGAKDVALIGMVALNVVTLIALIISCRTRSGVPVIYEAVSATESENEKLRQNE